MKRMMMLAMFVLMLAAAPALAETVDTTTIDLPTLQCGMCKKTIEGKMKGMKGLESIKVDVEESNAVVTYDPKVLTVAKIEKAIAAIGYDANETRADRRAQRKLDKCCQPGAHR